MQDTDLAQLGSHRADPCISIYLPVRVGDDDANRIALKSAWQETDEEMPERLQQMLDDPDQWDKSSEGVAIFWSAEHLSVHWLSFEPERHVGTGNCFHIAPLVQLLAEDTVFGVLAFQLGEWRFLQCTPRRSEPLQVDDAPSSVDDATSLVVDPIPGGASHAHTSGPGAVPPMQQQGFGHEDRQKNDAELYIRDLDAALVAAIGKELPVVLFGTPPWTSMYTEHTELNIVATEQTSPADLDDDELRSMGWRHVEACRAPEQKKQVDQVKHAMAHDQGSDALDTVAEMARQGGVDTLLVDAECHDERLVEAIAHTLTHGGKVLPEPTLDSPASAAFRWSPRQSA
jgi:hypothetical protein